MNNLIILKIIRKNEFLFHNLLRCTFKLIFASRGVIFLLVESFLITPAFPLVESTLFLSTSSFFNYLIFIGRRINISCCFLTFRTVSFYFYIYLNLLLFSMICCLISSSSVKSIEHTN